MACKWYDLCPLRRLERAKLIDQSWANAYCRSGSRWKDCKRYQLEEGGIPHSDSMLPDGKLCDTRDYDLSLRAYLR